MFLVSLDLDLCAEAVWDREISMKTGILNVAQQWQGIWNTCFEHSGLEGTQLITDLR